MCELDGSFHMVRTMKKDDRNISINFLLFEVQATVRELIFLLAGVGIGILIKIWVSI